MRFDRLLFFIFIFFLILFFSWTSFLLIFWLMQPEGWPTGFWTNPWYYLGYTALMIVLGILVRLISSHDEAELQHNVSHYLYQAQQRSYEHEYETRQQWKQARLAPEMVPYDNGIFVVTEISTPPTDLPDEEEEREEDEISYWEEQRRLQEVEEDDRQRREEEQQIHDQAQKEIVQKAEQEEQERQDLWHRWNENYHRLEQPFFIEGRDLRNEPYEDPSGKPAWMTEEEWLDHLYGRNTTNNDL